MKRHHETHRSSNVGWLRAAVLGANDGIVSTASLVMGVAASDASAQNVLLTGVAGLVAGALSMAAGEFVSVSSQADTESADIEREKAELKTEPEAELRELIGLYVKRGLSLSLAEQVAKELTSKDALAAHLHDELGLTDAAAARPLQAAGASAASFAVGAVIPLLVAAFSPRSLTLVLVSVTSLVCLAGAGAFAARAGGVKWPRPVLRVTFWGALAMGFTALVGRLFGVAVG